VNKYEALHDKYVRKAPISDELNDKLHAYVVHAFIEESRWAPSSKSKLSPLEQGELEAADKAFDLNLMIPHMQRICVRNGNTSDLGVSGRHVVGVLEFVQDLDRNDFTSSRFFAEASSSRGSDPKRLLPYIDTMRYHLPQHYITEHTPTGHPSSSMFLITAEHKAAGDIRLFVEGQIYGIIPGVCE
jgi:hypothetical protein